MRLLPRSPMLAGLGRGRILLAAALLLPASPAGAARETVVSDTRMLSEAVDDPLLEEAERHLYSFEYKKTQHDARRFTQEHPDNPFGHLFTAGAVWWQVTVEYGEPKWAAPELTKLFMESVDRTLETAKPMWKSDDPRQRPPGYFAAGMALGLRGQWKLANRKWFSAYRDGKRAIKYLKRCVKLDPDYYDAYLGLGIFDYQTAKLPGVLKLGAKLFLRGVGDTDRGLERIRLAMDKGRFASRQAAAFLLSIFALYEHDHVSALDLTRTMLEKYPGSPYYRFIEVMLLDKTGDWKRSYGRALELFELLDREPGRAWPMQRGTLCGFYYSQPYCLDAEQLEGAVRWLDRALAEADGSPPAAWRSMLHLYRGAARDLLKSRELAAGDYRAVLALPDFALAHAWASAYLKEPCAAEDAERMMHGLPPFTEGERISPRPQADDEGDGKEDDGPDDE